MDEQQDTQAIREVIDTWMRASAAGDIDRVLRLMAEDVVFLQPGRQPMRGREAFAAASRAMEGKFHFTGKPDIQEIHIAGDYAFVWNFLTITVTPLPDSAPMQRAGNILSVFRREPDGQWVLFRDANMLTSM